MKNLKKVLALGLALVMLLGMFTVVSAAETKTASDLADWDTVAHKDAVALMVDLGIIIGKDDGNFDPTGNIDRASWAKMVYFAKTGSDDADAYLGTATGLNDIAGNWAESYISYLKANNYISGDNYGNYNPSNNVTVAEANKMILTVLGYDADDRGYQNNATWSGNIMTDAKRKGLMSDVDRDQTALVPLTRENAAQIVYNAMSANTVTPVVQWDGGVKHVTDYSIDTTLGFDTFGIIPVEVLVNDVTENGVAQLAQVGTEDTNPGALLWSNIKGVKASASQIGENAIVWVEVNQASYNKTTGDLASYKGFVKTVSSTVAKAASAADVTLTQGFRWTDLCNPAKSNYVADMFVKGTENDATDLGGVKIYINGMANGGANNSEQDAVDIIKSVTWAGDEEVAGAVVEFYLDETGAIATIRTYIYNVAQLTGDAETRTSNGTLQVRLPGVTGLATWKTADTVTGYQGLKEGDVVLYYAGNNGVYVVEKAEKITGVVTGVDSSGKLTINGSTYKRTAMDNAKPAFGVGVTTPDGTNPNQTSFRYWANTTDEFAFYLDKTGAVCFTEQITETMSKSNIALVMAAEWNGTSMNVATGSLQAKLLFMDGTQEIVTVSKLEGKSVVTKLSNNDSLKADQMLGAPEGTTGTITDTETNQADADSYAIHLLAKANADTGTDKAFYNYSVVNGKYELEKVVEKTENVKDGDWSTTEAISAANILRQPNFANGKAGKYSADSNTVFLVAKNTGDDVVYYTYTGHTNIPEMASANGLAVGTNDSNAAKYVYLETESFSDDVPDGYVFVINNKWASDTSVENNGGGYINIVDATGDVTTLRVNKTIKGEIDAESNMKPDKTTGYLTGKYVGQFCSVDEIDDNGVVQKLTPINSTNPLKAIDALGAGVANNLNTDSQTVFVYVDMTVMDGEIIKPASDSAEAKQDALDDDYLEFSGAGQFNPANFYSAADVDTTKLPGSALSSEVEKSFSSILMTTIAAAGSNYADYVYVLRVVW